MYFPSQTLKPGYRPVRNETSNPVLHVVKYVRFVEIFDQRRNCCSCYFCSRDRFLSMPSCFIDSFFRLICRLCLWTFVLNVLRCMCLTMLIRTRLSALH